MPEVPEGEWQGISHLSGKCLHYTCNSVFIADVWMKMKYQEEHHVPTKSLMIDRILRELPQKMNFHKAQNQTVNPIQLAARRGNFEKRKYW